MGGVTMVTMPHTIPGCSWFVKLFHGKSCGRGCDVIQSSQMNPLHAISQTCVPPPDKGPKLILSISKASSLCSVRIGAEAPSVKGTFRWSNCYIGKCDVSGWGWQWSNCPQFCSAIIISVQQELCVAFLWFHRCSCSNCKATPSICGSLC